MWNMFRWLCLMAFLLCAGCNSRPTTTAVQGEVSYEGQTVEAGEIVFAPVDSTQGPSAVAQIKGGRYAVDQQWGLRPDGVYLVRITAFRKTGRLEPNRIDRGGPLVEVTENFIPPVYNTQSMLKVCVAELSDTSKVDFQLP